MHHIHAGTLESGLVLCISTLRGLLGDTSFIYCNLALKLFEEILGRSIGVVFEGIGVHSPLNTTIDSHSQRPYARLVGIR